MSRLFDRREVLLGAAALGLVPRGALAIPPDVLAALEGDCPTPSPSQTEGPYYSETGLFRRDITEGRPGMPLTLVLRILDEDCLPVEGAVVDVWHADADGIYSDVPALGTGGQTFMRGMRSTDAAGVARFSTIFPGWYPGRTPHVHVKVHLGRQELLTTQVYFENALATWIYTNEPAYAARGVHDTRNAQDGGYRPALETVVWQQGARTLAGITLTL